MKIARGARQWVKLWKDERGSFAQLPFVTRAVAAELLKFIDDDGRMFVGTKHPADALAFMAGATRGDRRIMRTAIDELIADRYLRVRDGWLEARGYGRWQYGDPTTTDDDAATNGNDGATTEQRPDHEAERPSNEDRAKSADSHVGTTGALSEKREEIEERREDRTGATGLSLTLTEPAPADPVQEVFDHWRAVMGTARAKLDKVRRRRIEAALASHGIGDAKAAIDGCARVDFNMGRDPKHLGVKHNDVELILRNAPNIERFRDIARRPSPGVSAWRPPTTAADYAASASTEDDDAAAVAALTDDDRRRLARMGGAHA